MGSSPVEQKEIESKKNELNSIGNKLFFSFRLDSILVKHLVQEQRRILKNAPKPKRNSGK
jgi:hypothetical protein